MDYLETNRTRQADVEKLLLLRYPVIALKLIEDEREVPENAVRPLRDWGKHIALCQAYAFSRRQNKVIYMEKPDHWCWSPLICFGMAEGEPGSVAWEEKVRTCGVADKAKSEKFIASLPHLPKDKYCGILTAPLSAAEFEPDVLLIYGSTAQIRLALMAINSQSGEMVDSRFAPLDSCIYSVIPPVTGGGYRITLPDPGEYERAFIGDDEIILSVPKQKYEEFFAGVAYQNGFDRTINSFFPMMKEDFPRPPFYNRVFESWGMETGDNWDKVATADMKKT